MWVALMLTLIYPLQFELKSSNLFHRFLHCVVRACRAVDLHAPERASLLQTKRITRVKGIETESLRPPAMHGIRRL